MAQSIFTPIAFWRIPITFPYCVELTDVDLAKLADFLPSVNIVKADPTKPASLKICWVDKHKWSITKSNIAEVDVMVGECIRDCVKYVKEHMPPGMPPLPTEWTPERVRDEAVSYIKSTCDRLDIEVTSDVKEEKFCFILPIQWRFKGILKNNIPVPFNITDTNKVCFTITHESPTLITIQLTSDLTQTVQATTSLVGSLVVLFVLIFLIRTILAAVKR